MKKSRSRPSPRKSRYRARARETAQNRWRYIYDNIRVCRRTCLSSVLLDERCGLVAAEIRKDQRFLNLSGQFGLPLPPLLRNLVKPTSIYRALVGRLPLTRKPRGSLTLTVLLLVRRSFVFFPPCMKFCKHSRYTRGTAAATDCLGL